MKEVRQTAMNPVGLIAGLVGLATLVGFAVLTGCQSPPRSDFTEDRVRGTYANEQEEVERTLQGIFDAAERKDLDRLEQYHLFGPKFTKFSEQGPRQDADVTSRSERQGIGGLLAFRPTLEDLKVDVFGEMAIATFTLRYEAVTTEQTLKGHSRATIVFVKVNGDGDGAGVEDQDGDWRITHEHFSPVEPKQKADKGDPVSEVKRLKVVPSKWYDRPCLVVRPEDLEQYSPATILILAERVGAYTWLHAPIDMYIVHFPGDEAPKLWTADNLVDEARRRAAPGNQ